MKKPTKAQVDVARDVLTRACEGAITEYFVAAHIVGKNGRLQVERTVRIPELGDGLIIRVQVESLKFQRNEPDRV